MRPGTSPGRSGRPAGWALARPSCWVAPASASAFALCLFLAGLFTFLTARRDPDIYADAMTVAMLYFLVAGVLALAIAVETYFQNWRWPWMALAAVGGATLLSIVLMAAADAAGAGLLRRSRDRRAHGRHPAARSCAC